MKKKHVLFILSVLAISAVLAALVILPRCAKSKPTTAPVAKMSPADSAVVAFEKAVAEAEKPGIDLETQKEINACQAQINRLRTDSAKVAKGDLWIVFNHELNLKKYDGHYASPGFIFFKSDGVEKIKYYLHEPYYNEDDEHREGDRPVKRIQRGGFTLLLQEDSRRFYLCTEKDGSFYSAYMLTAEGNMARFRYNSDKRNDPNLVFSEVPFKSKAGMVVARNLMKGEIKEILTAMFGSMIRNERTMMGYLVNE